MRPGPPAACFGGRWCAEAPPRCELLSVRLVPGDHESEGCELPENALVPSLPRAHAADGSHHLAVEHLREVDEFRRGRQRLDVLGEPSRYASPTRYNQNTANGLPQRERLRRRGVLAPHARQPFVVPAHALAPALLELRARGPTGISSPSFHSAARTTSPSVMSAMSLRLPPHHGHAHEMRTPCAPWIAPLRDLRRGREQLRARERALETGACSQRRRLRESGDECRWIDECRARARSPAIAVRVHALAVVGDAGTSLRDVPQHSGRIH